MLKLIVYLISLSYTRFSRSASKAKQERLDEIMSTNNKANKTLNVALSAAFFAAAGLSLSVGTNNAYAEDIKALEDAPKIEVIAEEVTTDLEPLKVENQSEVVEAPKAHAQDVEEKSFGALEKVSAPETLEEKPSEGLKEDNLKSEISTDKKEIGIINDTTNIANDLVKVEEKQKLVENAKLEKDALEVSPLNAAPEAQAAPQDEYVNIPDAGLRRAINEQLKWKSTVGRLDFQEITYNEIEQITELRATEYNIKNLEGLQHAKNLTMISFNQNYEITDLIPLRGLSNLRYLGINYSAIADLTPLQGLTNLQSLSLYANKITDLTPLAGLANLEKLDLYANKITDLTPLQGLTKLKELNLNNNQITDISPLKNLTGNITVEFQDLKAETIDGKYMSPFIDIDGSKTTITLYASDKNNPTVTKGENPQTVVMNEGIERAYVTFTNHNNDIKFRGSILLTRVEDPEVKEIEKKVFVDPAINGGKITVYRDDVIGEEKIREVLHVDE